MIAQLDGYLTGMNQLKDKSWKLMIVTQELKPEAVAILSQLSDYIKILLSDEGISDKMLKDFQELEVQLRDEPKSKSERLRNVMYRYHEQEEFNEEFQNWYNKRMEKFIQHYKDKLK